jgi:Ca-activated chloride channel family protein
MNLAHFFAHPERLWLLAAFAPLAAWAAFGARRRGREWASLAQGGRPPSLGNRTRFASLTLVVLALAQPHWGRLPGSEPPPGHDVILLVDVSRSMAAEDAVPDRLGVAIEAGASLLTELAAEVGDRAGVVAFAGRAVVRCPLTSHVEAAADALRALRPGSIQPGGTDLGTALEEGLAALGDEEHSEGRTLVVLTDGEDHAGSWESTLDRLVEARVVVHAVAIGDPEHGHPVPALRNEPRRSGTEAETRRSDVALRAVSGATGGAFVPLGLMAADLGPVYRERIAPTARRRRAELAIEERVERYPAFLLPAIALGLLAVRPGRVRGFGRRRAYLALALAAVSAGGGFAGEAETAPGLVELGRRAYAEGRFAEALGAFERAGTLAPGSAIPRYDAASALFQLRRHAEAIRRYEEARALGDAGLGVKIDFALGNTHLALGDLDGALARYDACLASTSRGAAFDLIRADAAANRDFAARKRKPPPEQTGPGDDPPKSRRGSPSPGPPGDPNGDADPSGSSEPPADPGGRAPSGSPGPSPKGPGRRGSGGAGGGGAAPPRGGSPEARLASALDDVKESRKRRAPDPPPSGSKGVDKDW